MHHRHPLAWSERPGLSLLHWSLQPDVCLPPAASPSEKFDHSISLAGTSPLASLLLCSGSCLGGDWGCGEWGEGGSVFLTI